MEAQFSHTVDLQDFFDAVSISLTYTASVMDHIILLPCH